MVPYLARAAWPWDVRPFSWKPIKTPIMRPQTGPNMLKLAGPAALLAELRRSTVSPRRGRSEASGRWLRGGCALQAITMPAIASNRSAI